MRQVTPKPDGMTPPGEQHDFRVHQMSENATERPRLADAGNRMRQVLLMALLHHTCVCWVVWRSRDQLLDGEMFATDSTVEASRDEHNEPMQSEVVS